MFQLKNIAFMLFAVSFICPANELVENAIKSDNDLNYAYKSVNKQLDETQKAKLKTAQLLWIKYRDTICEFEASLPKTGHWIEDEISNSRSLECISRLSITRTKELKHYSKIIGGTKSVKDIEYTDVIWLNEQLEKKKKKTKHGNAVIKGSFTVLIRKGKKHEYGSVTLNTQINPYDERNFTISLLANVVREFKVTYGYSPETYLIGKTVTLKGAARRGAIIKLNESPYLVRQNNTAATILPIGSLSDLSILE